ncbi:PIN domain-containing protein [Microlunatus parietis]|uniref:PIN domain nuclease of toxin-antitoxin system n=1 Tax=Microlunatus parietis TaxID=682979 RepID=A0A7Y9I9P5_9ACTN|nr:PIN domain-containing protein [Microlunatus parietis]NYE72546.1 PIN domain nuclease of toxin-antitoxin system [Microlunatus parietis]
MTALCLDSSIVCTLLLQEPGWQAVHRVILRDDVDGILPGPALTESITVVRRKGNTSTPKHLYEALTALGLAVEHPTDTDLIRAAELIEISIDNPGPPSPRSDQDATLSLGDALILAVTERLGCMVLTRDTYWKWMVDQGLLGVRVAVP